MKHPWSSQQFAEGARGSGRSEEVIVAAEEIAQKIKRTHPELPVILTLQHLAVLTDVSSEILSKIIDRYEDPYRIFRVKKRGSGAKGSAPVRKYRIICVPNPALMRVQRWIAQQILNVIEPHPASFAFAPDRGMVGAVERHAGSRWLIKIDVRNFFESIKESSVYRIFKDLGYTELLSFELSRICTRMHNGQKPFEPEQLFSGESRRPYRLAPQGHLPQGAPTSPMLANLAVRKLDTQLVGEI